MTPLEKVTIICDLFFYIFRYKYDIIQVTKQRGKEMEVITKLIGVLARNLGLTIVLVAAIILFAIFSDGLLAGAITALSALIAYTCCELLYREYKSATPAKKRPGKKSK